jgi:hypothetical protein
MNTELQEIHQNRVEKSKPERHFIYEIPLIIFRELSQHLGIGEIERLGDENSPNFRMSRKLDRNHPNIGFPCSVLVYRCENNVGFSLFDDRDKEENSAPIIEVRIQLGLITGQETKTVSFKHTLSLGYPGLRLIVLILLLVEKLAVDPNFVSDKRFWDI